MLLMMISTTISILAARTSIAADTVVIVSSALCGGDNATRVVAGTCRDWSDASTA